MASAEAFSGEKGKSLFYRPLPLVQYQVDWNAEVPVFLKRIVDSADDRSSTVLSSIIVEHHLDRILGLFIPGFDKLVHDHELGVSLKIDLLKALNLLPEHLLSFASTIARTRNKFAHSLALDSLDGMDQDSKNLIKSSYYAVSTVQKAPNKSLGDVFREMVQVTVMGIRSYESNVRLLTEIIRSDAFLTQLEGTYRTRFNEMLEKLRKLTAGLKGVQALSFNDAGEPILVSKPSQQSEQPSAKDEGQI